ncbi:PLDc N-terminal domain-containing protein [Natrinema salsiterrestre]|uniref:PLDc N-terminal domain-containing protein n=1 Tax=Natrinema salsiterrestre TaxID=2950540 RepID=A0A9Q4L021_9EURY|nr:PLDc N-terminal domain-containing protein [Natrinema salsiterrestre]MDF9745014.1 PLDc N-terminal domain-containing protein [Natrinema salsiterrestre]
MATAIVPMATAGTLVVIGLPVLFVVWIAAVIWVYSDCQTNSPHSPKVWAFIVFFGGLFGLVLYFRIGRGEPAARSDRRLQL